MIAFRAQLAHEWRCQRRRPFVIICALIYFAIAFGDAYQAGIGGEGFQWVNGADAIATRAIILSLFGILAVAGVMGEATSRDRDRQTEEMTLSSPAGRVSLGLPRFLVGWFVCVAIGVCFVPGMILGSMMPGILPEQLGPTNFSHYVKAVAYYIAPNFFIIAAFTFAVGSRWRKQSVTWLAAVGLLVIWILTRMLIGQDILRHDVYPFYALLEPFGTSAGAQYAMEWTVLQNNEQFVPFRGYLLWNRLLWVGVACLLVVMSVRWLPLQPAQPNLSRKRKPRSRLAPAWMASNELLLSLRWEWTSLLRQPGLRLFLLLAAISLWFTASSAITHQFSLPTTDLLVHNTGFYFDKILILVLVWSAADLIWRERHYRVHEVVDALPTVDTRRFLAKTIALLLIILAFWGLSIAVNVAYQAANGFYHFELSLHFIDSFVMKAPFYLFMGILAISLQALVRNRYIAIGAFLLAYVWPVLLDGLGKYHPIFRFGQSNFFWYSLMDGYGHFWKGHLWFLAFWTFGAAFLWIIAAASLSRGTHPRPRRALLGEHLLRGKGGLATVTLLCLGFVGTGAAIWHQTAVQNTWPLASLDALKAEVEKKYGEQWRSRAQPRVVRINSNIELFPNERRLQLNGEYTLHNPSQEPIKELLILCEPHLKMENIAFSREATRESLDPRLKTEHWTFETPLPPGDRMTMRFNMSWQPKPGFRARAKNDGVNEVGPTEVLGNGTSLLNLQLMPAVGYTDRVEHKPQWKRRKYGLPLEWSAPEGDYGLNQPHDTLHLDWIEQVDTTITTSGDQIPLHAGKVISDDVLPDGRRRIHYRIDRPSRGWSAVLSGRYETKKLTPPDTVPVEFFYDPRYAYTLDEMETIFTEALSYFEQNYGAPPFDDFKMAMQSLHFDGMGNRAGLGFATEILGWKADVRRSGGDGIRKMAAHMMGMSWFGDQIIPANVAGAKVIHAGLPYWSAGLYLHETRAPSRSRELRLQEMGELFRSRRALKDEESPFDQEHKDSSMIRRKGLILMTYLSEIAGSENVIGALQDFLERYRYQPAPYPTADDFVETLEARIPAEFHPQIDDIFRKITRWDLTAVSASAKLLDDETWEVTATVETRKYQTKGLGEEIKVPMDSPVFIAVGSDPSLSTPVLAKALVRPGSGRSTFILKTEKKPEWFFLDPDFLLPDPNPRNQSIPITINR